MQRLIIQFPNARLKLRAKEVDVLKMPHEDVRDLRDTFEAYSGCIGLAAPQIGIEKRIVIVDISPSRGDTYIMLNPLVIKESEDQQRVEDGCMSVGLGKEYYSTKRPKRICVKFVDYTTSMPRTQKFTGLMAACIHHEIDHLNGVMMFDRAVSVRRVVGS